jgi:hypothetical protein
MPARDEYHDCVRNALVKDGWSITADPYRVMVGEHSVYMDLAAEQVVSAEKDGRRIAVEIKGFPGRSPVYELEQALGQYLIYRSVLRRSDPERKLYLAVPEDVFLDVLQTRLGRMVTADYWLEFLLFDSSTEVIVRWIDSTSTEASSGPS